ncbi:hypothetical protein MMC14_006184 [Varicellaria rhodocarpa]|nr:hypothetical protein [Varicellaria rhodocarpa]
MPDSLSSLPGSLFALPDSLFALPDSLSAMPDSLSSLPVELLRPIIAPLAKKEPKALRLANRKLYILASEILFETVAITTTDASFAQLLNIIASETWSAQVRHIDWVLLHGRGVAPHLAQDLKLYRPWSNTVRQWKLKPSRGAFWYGLLLQCQLIQRMPNVQTVRFWSAVNSQRIEEE